MLRDLKLGTKFTVILLLVFMAGVIVGGIVLWQVLQKSAQAEITTQGLILIETMNAVRSYTNDHIDPLLADDLATRPEFISETVPAYSAREVFENFRQDDPYTAFHYKEASLNPTNPRDKADQFEAPLVEKMRRDPNRKEESGFRNLAGKDVYYIARPLVVTTERCLGCHGSPENAPQNLIATYGAENGFGWQLNEVVAAQIIYVPAREVFNVALRSFALVMTIFVVVFAIVIWLINYLLKQYVIEPVGIMAGVADKISADEVMPADIEAEALSNITTRADELGHLAQVFQGMAREVYGRVRKLKAQVQSLRIEIDQIKQKEQVAEVVETDFFRDLQAKAEQIRRRKNRKNFEG